MKTSICTTLALTLFCGCAIADHRDSQQSSAPQKPTKPAYNTWSNPAPTQKVIFSYQGAWATKEFGNLRIEQTFGEAWGMYDHQGGRVKGTISEKTFSGIWTQTTSSRACRTQQNGSWYWGRFELHQTNDGKAFLGRWSYCDDPALSGGEWTGTRIDPAASSGTAQNNLSARWQTPSPPDSKFADTTDHSRHWDNTITPQTPANDRGRVAASSLNDSRSGFSGDWHTTQFGDMHIDLNGDNARGTYSFKNGRVLGTVSGDSFNGYWMQQSSGRRCNTEQYGSVYWGRFELHLGNDGSYWKGRWSYCDDPALSGGEWNGTRP